MSERWAVFEEKGEAMGFTQIENILLKHQDVSLAAKGAYSLLKSFAWTNPNAWPGFLRLKHESGVGERALRTAVTECKNIELIEIHRRGPYRTNLYVFKSLKRWLEKHPFVKWEETEEGIMTLRNAVSSNGETQPQETPVSQSEEYEGGRSKEEEVVSRSAPTPFTLFCDLMNAEGLEVTDEDRTKLAGNLNKVAKKLEPGEKIGRVIRHLVDRRARGVTISPQAALNDVRTGNTNGAAVHRSPESVLSAFERADDRLVRGKAYLALSWDFTRAEKPRSDVLKMLGERPAEQEKMWKRMRRIAITATEGE